MLKKFSCTVCCIHTFPCCSQTDKASILSILRPRVTNSGTYTLHAFTPDANASAEIQMLVYGEYLPKILKSGEIDV